MNTPTRDMVETWILVETAKMNIALLELRLLGLRISIMVVSQIRPPFVIISSRPQALPPSVQRTLLAETCPS